MKYFFSFFFLLLLLKGQSQVNLTQGLMAYYPFNGNTGDSSGNGNHPVFNNATLTADRFGNANKAYNFDGATSYMRIPNAASLNMGNSISVCAWVQVKGFYTGPCRSNRIMNKGDDDGLSGSYNLTFQGPTPVTCNDPVDSARQNFYGVASGTVPNTGYTPYIQKSTWYFVVYTYDGTTAKMYVNNQLKFSTAASVSTFTNTYDLFFGKLNRTGYQYWFKGDLDEVRIYNRAITAGEVAALYTPAPLTVNDGLMAYYPFNGNAGDSSGNGNHPSFNNATLTADRFGNANKAYSFNGTSSYIRVPNSTSLNSTNTLSLSFWVKVKGFYYGTCHANYVLAKGQESAGGSYGAVYSDIVTGTNCSSATPDTTKEIFYGLGVTNGADYLQKNTWYHIVYTYDGTTVKYYANGVLLRSNAASITSFTNAEDLFFGKLNSASFPYWLNADLDEIRIYNRAITATEVATLYTPATTLPSDGLMAYYPFNGNAGDSSGNGNHITTNTATLTADRFGNANKAYLFNGTSSYMSAPSTPSLGAQNKISICTWIKINGFYQGQCHANWILSKGLEATAGTYAMQIADRLFTNNNSCNITLPDEGHETVDAIGAASPMNLQKNTWYFVVATNDGSQTKIYINNQLMVTSNAATSFANSPYDLFIGRYPNASPTPYWFNGVIDDIRIYNRAITASEVNTLYNENGGTSISCNAPSSQQLIIRADTLSNGLFRSTNVDNLYFGSATDRNELDVFTWTADGAGVPLYNARSLVKYNISSIPANAVVNSAKLYFYAKKSGAYCGIAGQPTYGTNNTVLLQKITSTWELNAVRINNLPLVDAVTQKLMPSSTNTAQDYVVDITDFAQKWVNKPDSNFGILLRMQTENNPYNSMIFESGRATDSTKRLRLEVCYTLSVLPITLKEFTGELVNNTYSILHIKTTNEVNASSIVIERSYDGYHYDAITVIAAKNTATNQYEFTDNTLSAINNKVYYRLKLVNKDGTFTYSSIVAFDIKTDAGVTLYPNPAKDFVQLQVKATKEEKTDIKVLDISGKTVLTQPSRLVNGVTNISINNINKLTKGVYLIQLVVNKELITKKLVIE